MPCVKTASKKDTEQRRNGKNAHVDDRSIEKSFLYSVNDPLLRTLNVTSRFARQHVQDNYFTYLAKSLAFISFGFS